jgi:hypothetical protein
MNKYESRDVNDIYLRNTKKGNAWKWENAHTKQNIMYAVG